MAEALLNAGAEVILISTDEGRLQATTNEFAYGTAKGGLKSMTRSLAVSLGKYGIRVNNIGPGYIQTDMTGLSWNDPALRERRRQSTILKRWGQPATWQAWSCSWLLRHPATSPVRTTTSTAAG